VHGDDKGLVLPPRVAPIQIVIVPIYYSPTDRESIINKANEIAEILKKQNLRIHVDGRDEFTPGYKFNDWEMKGVPLRIEIGPKDLAKGKMVLVRRDISKKSDIPFGETEVGIMSVLDDIQKNLYNNAKKILNERTKNVSEFEEFKKELDNGFFLYSPWCGDQKCEETIKETTGADIRVIPFDNKKSNLPCIICKKPSITDAIFARGY
ncbi:MAG TPA: His/Gly/Thr/Pro-type tRNA ligase C-terminal domain-containing protein, partial [Candidatus Bathyarchaeia archaeon]|nr:His/Gly/Thr/Pro-type tRNA ligase C-terminal domain-containing protein [Candidatus Bathyarchaeia archaeon]